MDKISSCIPEIQLNRDGPRIPLLGMGTATSLLGGSESTKTALLQAIETGYRHFDTATLYNTEQPLGEAIDEALSRGIVKSRDELFITSKIWCSDAHSHLVLPAIQKSLRNLQLECIDLYLIHWPVSSRTGIYEFPVKKEDFIAMDFESVWAAMEECRQLGLTKSIGVSNFSRRKISDILAIAKIPPAVCQVEMNPLWQQKNLREFCRANGILVTAYSALGASGTVWGSNRVLENPVLKEIANAKRKTVAQVQKVCLRWAYEQGVCVLVKTFNQERMKQNMQIFDWELCEEESKKIGEIPQSRGCLGEDYISPNGPIKTIEELWDGEL